jgi:DNA-binding IclR family transcriptional regulator
MDTDELRDENGGARPSSVDNALELLRELVQRGSMRVHEAASHLGVARSTAHRLLAALGRHGFVQQRTAGGSYYPVVMLDPPAVPRVTRDARVGSGTPVVRALRDETEETAHLAVLQGNGARFLVGFEGLREPRTATRVGLLLPAHATAAGKVILAALPPDTVRNLYPRGAQTLSDLTLGSAEEIIEHLRLVARRGYATNVAEAGNDLTAIAVVVRDARGAPVAALAIAGPSIRMPHARVPHLVARLQRAALDVQVALSE